MPWKTIVAKVPGLVHREHGQKSQDYVSFRSRGEFIAAAVADGTGSTAYGDHGAEVAVKAFTNSMNTWHDNYVSPNAAHAARAWDRAGADAFRAAAAAVLRRSQEMEQPIHELATTLVTIAANRQQVCIRQTGDGGVIVMDQQGSLSLPNPPQKGRWPNETRFITQEGEPSQGVALTIARDDVAALLLFTDGLERILLNRAGQPHDASAGVLIRWAMNQTDTAAARAEIETSLTSEDNSAMLTIDDAALCIAIAAPP